MQFEGEYGTIPTMKERLQKLLSGAGLCSRREAEKWILAGRVTVNGSTAGLGDGADPDTDTVCVDGKPVGRRTPPVTVLLNKPAGYVTTMHDEQGRRTVAELVRDVGVRGRVW